MRCYRAKHRAAVGAVDLAAGGRLDKLDDRHTAGHQLGDRWFTRSIVDPARTAELQARQSPLAARTGVGAQVGDVPGAGGLDATRQTWAWDALATPVAEGVTGGGLPRNATRVAEPLARPRSV